MLRHFVPGALERYRILRCLSRAEAIAELEQVEDVLGPERPTLVVGPAVPARRPPTAAANGLVAGLTG